MFIRVLDPFIQIFEAASIAINYWMLLLDIEFEMNETFDFIRLKSNTLFGKVTLSRLKVFPSSLIICFVSLPKFTVIKSEVTKEYLI